MPVMLVEFSVANFRSIAGRQTLSMVASADRRHRGDHVREDVAKATPGLLTTAVLYGANGAGKSNILLALDFMRVAVITSFQAPADAAIAVTPFAFAESPAQSDSEFEVIFVEAGVRYQYGFVIDNQRVRREWLYAFPDGKQQRWFERGGDHQDAAAATQVQEPKWYFGPHFQGQKRLWQDATRANALFLSTAIQLNAEQLRPVYDWFASRLAFIGRFQSMAPAYTAERCLTDAAFKQRVIDLLRQADLHVDDVDVRRERIDRVEVQTDAADHVRQFLAAELVGREIPVVSLVHRAPNGREARFKLDEESAGTERLFGLVGPLLDVLDRARVLVVDELDSSLHAVLVKELVALFHQRASNPRNAQLVFSTHDTTLLDQDLFRRDQIWLVEKDRDLATTLVPLTDFSPRKGENLEKGYLQGRYGARPLVRLVG
jgi:AAA15 family ATPase/GTPase